VPNTIESEYGLQLAQFPDGVSRWVIACSSEETKKLYELIGHVTSDTVLISNEQFTCGRYSVIEKLHTLNEVLAAPTYDDMKDSDARMAVALALLQVASRLEQNSREFRWSIKSIYLLNGTVKLNPLGITKCKGRYAAIENRKLLIRVLRYVMTGDYEGQVREEHGYVFKQMTKKALPLQECIMELASHVFNHARILDFFNGLGEYILAPITKIKVPGVAPKETIEEMIDEMNHKILRCHNRYTDNWVQPSGQTESRCAKASSIVGFNFINQDGKNITQFIRFMRNYQEHWRGNANALNAAKSFYEQFMKTKIENSPNQKPTFFYRYITEVYQLMFVKIFKIATKYLSKFGQHMHIVFQDVSVFLERELGREYLNKLSQ
jgi:hypothetical protein